MWSDFKYYSEFIGYRPRFRTILTVPISTHDVSVQQRLKQGFVAGLLLVLPFVVAGFVFTLLLDWSLVIVDPLVDWTGLAAYTSNDELAAKLVAAGSVVAGIVLIGVVFSHEKTNHIRGVFGKIVNFVPLLGTVYMSVRQVASSIGETDSRFKKLVKVEYPRENIYSLGLMTSEAPEELQGDEKLYSVFFPNSPNPTGGRTVLVPEDEIVEVEMSVQKGLKLMLTTGIAYEKGELHRHVEGMEEDR